MRTLLRPLLAMSLVVAFGAEAFAATGYGNASYGSQMSFDSFNYSVRKRLESTRIGSIGGRPLLGGGLSSRRPAGDNYGPGPGGPGYANPGQSYGGSGPAGYDQGYNANPAGYAPAPGYNGGGYNSGGYNPNPGYNSNLNTNYNPNSYGTNGYSYAPSFSSDGAYAMAPSSRASSVASARRRQLDCVYYSGFTVWGDLYQTWARQRSTGVSEEGYKFRTFGPAVGIDWTSGPMTLGAAMTYNWGKLRGRDISHDQKIETWALDLYGQYNADNFYISGSLGYGHNRFNSDRGPFGDRFTSNAFNLEGEFGWKMNWSGLQVIPTAGLRYFHDRRGNINEGAGGFQAGTDKYHVLELPLGASIAYEISGGGMVFVPRGRLAWIPELDRVRSSAGGEVGARRSRHGFQAGLGLEGRFTETLSAHIDYNCNFRSKQYEHHWNLGMGFTF